MSLPMECEKRTLSNDQHLISILPTVISSLGNSRTKNLTEKFSYLLEYIYTHAENPAALLYNIGIIIINQNYIIIKRQNLSRYLNYSKSTFSAFYQKNYFTRTSFESLNQFLDTSKLEIERHWLPYKIDHKSIYFDKFLNCQTFWANNDLLSKPIGLLSPMSLLLDSFRPSIIPKNTTIAIMA